MQHISTEGLINKQELVKEIIRPTRRRKRFINSLLDGVFLTVFFYAIVFIVSMIYGLLALINEEDSYSVFNENNLILVFYLGFYVCYLGYFIGFEYYFGKSIGKMVTNTKVVMIDGSKPKLIKIIMRSFARMIPFDVFTFLSKDPRGWHDTISDTIVIDDISLYRIGTKSVAEPNILEV